MIIAVDFDGTIVEHCFPEIGEPLLFAFETLKELHKQGHRLILWTCREGANLQQAVDFCAQNGVHFYAVNKNYPEQPDAEVVSCPKIVADLYIDDRIPGGFPGWSAIWQQLSNSTLPKLEEKPLNYRKKKRWGIF